MHPKGHAKYFYWPMSDDKCWVPCEHTISPLSVPQCNLSGRNYSLNEEDIVYTIAIFSKINAMLTVMFNCSFSEHVVYESG